MKSYEMIEKQPYLFLASRHSRHSIKKAVTAVILNDYRYIHRHWRPRLNCAVTSTMHTYIADRLVRPYQALCLISQM